MSSKRVGAYRRRIFLMHDYQDHLVRKIERLRNVCYILLTVIVVLAISLFI